MSQAVIPQHIRRARPVQFSRPVALKPLQDDGGTILGMLGRLNLSQWLALLFPVFVFAIHRRRDEGDVAVVDTSAVLQIALTAVVGLWSLNRVLGALRTFEKTLFVSPLRWLLAYGVLAVLSCTWSEMPTLTLFRGVQLVVFLLLVVDAVSSLRDERDMLQYQLLYAAMAVLCRQVPLIQEGISIRALHSSDAPGTIIAAVFMGVLLRGRQWRILHMVLVAAMMLATSTGSLFACVGGVIVILFLMRGRAAGFAVILLCGSVLCLLAMPQVVNNIFFFGKESGQIINGTGRVPIWQWILEERVPQHPLLGFGFAMGEVQARLYNIGGFRMMHMHNAFMSALVNLGLMGVVLWALMWAGMTRTAWKVTDPATRRILLGAAAAVFLNTISMESVTAPMSIPWIGHAIFFATLVAGRWSASPRLGGRR